MNIEAADFRGCSEGRVAAGLGLDLEFSMFKNMR